MSWLPNTSNKLKSFLCEVDERSGGRDPSQLFSVSQIKGVIPNSRFLEGAEHTVDYSKYKTVMAGDLVLNRFNAYRGALGIAPARGIVSPDYVVLRRRGPYGMKFFDYWLRSEIVSNAMKSTMGGLGANDPDSSGFSRISVSALLTLGVEVSQESEREEIASYLDKETSQIDNLISKKEQLIEKLLERRQALITQVVTKGLDPNVPMKDSGVEWLGAAPASWAVGRVQRFAEFKSGGGFPESHQGNLGEEIPFLKVDDLGKNKGPIISSWQNTVSLATATELGVKVLPTGTLIMAKIGAALLLGRVKLLEVPSCIDNNMIGITPSPMISHRYLSFFLSILDFAYFVNPGTVPSTSGSAIGANQMPVPPLSEQKQIALHLDKETSQMDTLVEKTRKAIELLKERRQALITQVVTGKIDVRGFAGGNS